MNRYLLMIIVAMGIMFQNSFAKILIIVEQGYYNAQTARINQFANDVQLYDGKTVQIIPWPLSGGTNVQQCQPLWSCLELAYGCPNDQLMSLQI